jgi:hypothetical protein
MARSGDWFCTYSGGQYWLTDPHPDDISITDIAHALGLICRFGGHTTEFYSVAQHSVHCADLVALWKPQDHRLQLYTLLHDSSEAFLGDIVRPLKRSMPEYVSLEKRTALVILQALKLDPPSDAQLEIVKKADDILLMTERQEFIVHKDTSWGIDALPLNIKLGSLLPAVAELRFITRYITLRAKVDATI